MHFGSFCGSLWIARTIDPHILREQFVGALILRAI